jgi:hypothetical protein
MPVNPRGGAKSRSYDRAAPGLPVPRKVLKGSSHLCAPNYCRRYRPAARHPQPIDTSTSHIGASSEAKPLIGPAQAPSSPQHHERPRCETNIVLVLMDNLGWGDRRTASSTASTSSTC